MSGLRYTPDARERARALYESGWSLHRITHEPGMPSDRKTLQRWFAELGVPTRGNEPVFPRAEILAALKRRVPRKELAAKYGCSLKYLSRLATGKLRVEEPKPPKTTPGEETTSKKQTRKSKSKTSTSKKRKSKSKTSTSKKRTKTAAKKLSAPKKTPSKKTKAKVKR